MMRSSKILRLAAAAAALSGTALPAQFGGPGDGPPPGGPPMESRAAYQEPSAQQTLKRLAKDLKLTNEQKLKIKPILDDEQKQMAAAGAESEAKAAAIEENTWSQIRPLLMDAQHKKFEAFTEKMAKRRARAARMAEEDDGPPAGPPPGGGGPPPFGAL